MKKIIFTIGLISFISCNKNTKEQLESEINAHVDSAKANATELVDSTAKNLKSKADSVANSVKDKAKHKADSIANDVKEKAKAKAKEEVNKKIDEAFN